ncbi:MAG TPA: thioesterase domain-containing protein [Stellaceae bacterium]|nr:thioesterase domain-containing protein [Stellaceae bacterium]
MTEPLVRTDTAQLFRSVRAARSWLRTGAAGGAAVAGCILMKPGNDEPPVFMIPGAPGSILQLGPIAAAMTIPAPVYAIRPRGMVEQELPFEHLDEMAGYAIGLMRAVRPQGPYLLVGYSAGGLVVLEMAQQLTAAGSQVPLIVLLDTYPSRAVWPLACHLDILARQALKAVWSLRKCTLREIAGEGSRHLRSLFQYLTASGLKLVEPPPLVAEGTDAASRRVHVATYNAGEAYRPRPYGGKVVFMQPEETPGLEPRKPRQVWGRFLDDLQIRHVPGSHLKMVEEGAAATTAEIDQCIAEALGA